MVGLLADRLFGLLASRLAGVLGGRPASRLADSLAGVWQVDYLIV